MMHRWAWMGVGMAAWTACGGGASGDAGIPDAEIPVIVGRDLAQDEGAQDIADEAAGRDPFETQDTGEEEAGEACAPGFGEPGCPCRAPDDCVSGLCVDTRDGLRCTLACQSSDPCPRGWICAVISNTGGDVVYGCIDPFARLCQPCRESQECVPAVGAPGVRYSCIPFGPEGAFCAASCGDDGDCPEGFSCRDPGSGAGKACLPPEGTPCPCTEKYRLQGNLTECFVENEFGTCRAPRTCDQACGAKVPEAETCNAVDDDCDGQTDEEVPAENCTVQTEYGLCPGKTACEAGGRTTCQGQAPSEDVCDGLDNDCDGNTDPEGAKGCVTYFRDEDGDGRGVTGDTKCLCAPSPPYRALSGGDCDDQDQSVFPGAQERCNGKDDNCNGKTDETGAQGCRMYYRDEDGDRYGVEEDGWCECGPFGVYTATLKGDCNDLVPEVNPGAIESCNGRDDDCDGLTDEDDAEGCTLYYQDLDGDQFGKSDVFACKCRKTPPFTATQGGDCNDNDKMIRPSAVEICNGLDDNCDGLTDKTAIGYEDLMGCTRYWKDQDRDGYGNGMDSKCLCGPMDDYQAPQQEPVDCDDRDNQRYPGATEVCNGKDDDCDGSVDEAGAQGCNRYYYDSDRDGYGVTNNSQCYCGGSPNGWYTAVQGGDCDDTNPLVRPGVSERCDTPWDDNCNGEENEEGATACQWYMLDQDGDGYGVDGPQKCLCAPKAPYTGTDASGDCCDTDARVHYGQTAWFTGRSKCGNFDYNCDGREDRQYNNVVRCGSFPDCGNNVVAGWQGTSIPDCGQTGTWSTDCSGFLGFNCEGDSSGSRTQGCH